MQRYKDLLVFALILILGTVWSVPTLAQETTPANNDVAILVIDVFEENKLQPQVLVSNLPHEGLDCAMAFGGLDGSAYRGNTVVLSSLYPFSVPHGRMVFNQFETMLNNKYGNPPGSQAGNPNSTIMPTVLENWNTPRGKIWLAAVDTHQYNINQIASQTLNAVNLLSLAGVHKFVLNMSFGLIPCDKYPQLTVEAYKAQLTAWGINCSEDAGLPELACTVIESNEENFVDNLIKIRDAGGPQATAFALLHLAVMRTLMIPTLQAAIPNPLPTVESQNFLALLNDLPTNNTYIQVASAGNDDLPFPYYPAIADNVLAVKADYTLSSCQQGSEPEIHDFLMNQLNFTKDAADEVTADLANPGQRKSNAGEVKHDGNASALISDYLVNPPADAHFLGCVFGSSFSAPQVSVLMAQDQQTRNSVECGVDAASNPISPPLGYKEWDNLDIPTAAATYCPDFPQ